MERILGILRNRSSGSWDVWLDGWNHITGKLVSWRLWLFALAICHCSAFV